jgi:protoporphyrin/coproporphyrin ferrochelatase
MSFTAQASFKHEQKERTAVLLVQLGTPEAPQAGPVRRYLREFLSDPRVVEIPRLIWWLILNGIILQVRPKRSAAKYATVWTKDGSPLKVISVKQAKLLQGYLGEAGLDVDVALAMRYGSPSISSVLQKLRERGMQRLLVVPMYPQYAASTTATVVDEVMRELARWRNQPEIRTIKHFHRQAEYIDALAQQVQSSWEREGPPQNFVMSFHGVPKFSLLAGDPYHCECLVTGRLLAEKLGLTKDQYTVTFQSRFGRAEWLQPYTEPTLQELGRNGAKRVDVFCPGFVADCLETIEEIGMEARAAYEEAGGKDYRTIDCLNDSPAFIRSLVALVKQHTGGWPVQRFGSEQQRAVDDAYAKRRERALAGGASV